MQLVAYAEAKMEAANVKMLNGLTAVERIRAGKWVTVWSMVAGADPPSRLKLRMRSPAATK